MARITVVEDREGLCALVGSILAERGHDVRSFASAGAALRDLTEGPPDLLVADAHLAEGTCRDLLLRLDDASRAAFPVVVLSGVSGEGQALERLLPPDGRRWARFGRYRILALIGRGSSGVVYRAREDGSAEVDGAGEGLAAGAPVALKVIATPPAAEVEAHRRLLREIYALSSVRHPNVVPVLDFGIHRGRPYYAMKEIPGPTLRRHVEDVGPAEPARVVGLLLGLARALSSLHSAEIVHRDVTPSNVILRDGRWDAPVLIDFGLAKHAFDRGLTHDNVLLGTPGYVAPEALLGANPDARSDLFSLGLVGLFAATGEEAFPDLDGLALIHHMSQFPVSVPRGLPAPLRSVLERLTRIDPAARFARADDVADALATSGATASLPGGRDP